MAVQNPNNMLATKNETATLIAPAVLDNLAARIRSAGLSLFVLKNDGTVAYHDSTSGTFFQRYVLPQIQYPEQSDTGLIAAVKSINASSGVIVSNHLPGVLLAICPYSERRQIVGMIVLAAKSESFDLNEDVLRVCSRLGIDGTWLGQQAESLATFNEESIQRHARLMLTMLRDQSRLAGLEQELNSLSGQLANTYEELSLIYQLSGGMRVNRRASDFFKQACLDVLDVMGVEGMGVALLPGTLAEMEPVLYGPRSLPPGEVHRLAKDLLRWLGEHKTPLLINDFSRDKKFGWMAQHARQLLAVPMQRQDKVIGCFFAIDKTSDDFNSVDSKLLNSIANESAIYLENAMLFDDVHGLMMGLLHSLTSAVDAKDAYTCGHSERVALLSKNIALKAKLPQDLAERIYMAGLLHDVGKIGVPEAVLGKPGRLTDEEFVMMKKHPEIGARILHDIKQIKDIIPGVLYHHERFDGKGYPTGLSGHDIPMMGRIICMADCFDAMTTNRTYRKAMPFEVALAEIRRCAGTHFDPELAEAFLEFGAEGVRNLLAEFQKPSKKVIDLQEILRSTRE